MTAPGPWPGCPCTANVALSFDLRIGAAQPDAQARRERNAAARGHGDGGAAPGVPGGPRRRRQVRQSLGAGHLRRRSAEPVRLTVRVVTEESYARLEDDNLPGGL